MELIAKWELSGPFFEKDPGKTVRGNISDMLDKVAVVMQDSVRDDIAAHAGAMPRYSGWSWAHVRGYTTSPYEGTHWALWAAVNSVTAGMSDKDAIRTKAAGATIERRWHPYRNTKQAAWRVLRNLDFVKGLT